jgi:hypothetical protein
VDYVYVFDQTALDDEFPLVYVVKPKTVLAVKRALGISQRIELMYELLTLPFV